MFVRATKRELILGAGALAGLAACGQGEKPDAQPTASADPIDIVTPPKADYALAILAARKGLWRGLETTFITSEDEASTASAINSRLIEIAGMPFERYAFWRSGGTLAQLIGIASRDQAGKPATCYVVRSDAEQEDALVKHIIAGLRQADAFLREHPEEALRLVALETGEEAQPADIRPRLVTADMNRDLFAAASSGQPAAFAELRAVDERLRDEGRAGHVALLPDAIAPAAAAAWAE
jgi:ABC-type nitrate/sulfonate/bicarbonate transport system substrate-binding protein